MDFETPSTGRLSSDSDCLYESQGAAIAVVVLLALAVAVLSATNVLTIMCLCRRRTEKIGRDECRLPAGRVAPVGATNEGLTADTVLVNKGAGIHLGGLF